MIDLGDQSDSRSVYTTSSLNYSQTGSSTGSKLGWDSKPALNSVYTPTPIETPEPPRRILNCSTRRDIVLKLNIAPVRQNRCFSRIKALLYSGANTIFIDRKWARIRKIPLLPMPNPIPVYNVDGTRYAQVPRPLNDLPIKDQAFEWKESQQTAFNTLKQ